MTHRRPVYVFIREALNGLFDDDLSTFKLNDKTYVYRFLALLVLRIEASSDWNECKKVARAFALAAVKLNNSKKYLPLAVKIFQYLKVGTDALDLLSSDQGLSESQRADLDKLRQLLSVSKIMPVTV